LDRRYISRDYRRHDLLERPRDNPRRSALAAAVLSLVLVVFAAGSADRLFFQFGFAYEGAIWFFRGAFFVVPVLTYALTRRICAQLARAEAHPLREWDGQIVSRNRAGGFETVPATAHRPPGNDKQTA
jgi:ubiquinol-cytochrome c reductase cytochrome b subunit